MKNVTVAVPDEVYRAARIKAAEAGTSVSALVAAYLRDLADDGDFARKEAMQDEALASITTFAAADRLPRDEVHARAVR